MAKNFVQISLGSTLLTLLLISITCGSSSGLKIVLPKIILHEYCVSALHENGRRGLGENCTLHSDPVIEGNSAFEDFTTFEKNRTFTFRNGDRESVIVMFECSAPYPVTWTHSQDEWIHRPDGNNGGKIITRAIPLLTRYKRVPSVISDPSSPSTFSVLLGVTNGTYELGEYVCRSMSDVESGKFGKAFSKIAVFSNGFPYLEKMFPFGSKSVTTRRSSYLAT